MTTIINIDQEPCHQTVIGPPCPPDGPIVYDHVEGPELAFFIIFASIAIGLFLHQTLIGRPRRNRYSPQDAREAAERVSAELRPLKNLQGKQLINSCRAVTADMLMIVDFILWEGAHYCYHEPPEEEDVLRGIFRVRSEALALRRQLRLTRFLLRFGSQSARVRSLTLKAAHRYVSVLMPMVKELHGMQSQWRENLPLFKIKMPNGCEGT